MPIPAYIHPDACLPITCMHTCIHKFIHTYIDVKVYMYIYKQYTPQTQNQVFIPTSCDKNLLEHQISKHIVTLAKHFWASDSFMSVDIAGLA